MSGYGNSRHARYDGMCKALEHKSPHFWSNPRQDGNWECLFCRKVRPFVDSTPKPKCMRKAPQTHDYTIRFWGHDYVFEPKDGGLKGDMIGWGHGLRNGDYLLLKNGNSSTRYKIESVKYLGDPPDMWEAKVRFFSRTKTTATHEEPNL